MTKPRVRFAPSPTGKLHIGHLRAAVPNYLFAKRHGGTFILRFEDTDLDRNQQGAEDAILADLKWLGLEPDESVEKEGNYGPYRTIQRAERGDYKKAIEELMSKGRAYECFMSEDELDVLRKVQRARKEPPHYDNRHRDLSEEQKQKFRAEGRQPVIRFKLGGEAIEFEDIIRGSVRFEVKNMGGDPVIVRSNGIPLFTLAGVVDDINQAITHVIRGEDHVANTAIQVQIFEALGAKLPTFAHSPMLLDKEGHKFSKRRGSAAVADLREAGYLPQAVVGYMASLGFSELPATLDFATLAETYPLEGAGRAAVRFDEEQLARTNTNLIHSLSFTDAKPYLAQYLSAEAMKNPELETFWNAVHGNLESLPQVKEMYDICFGDLQPTQLTAEDISYIEQAEQHLPSGTYTAETWGEFVNKVKDATGRKGKQLFMPLRQALTGQSHGPELADLLPLIGEVRARQRLKSVKEAQAAA